MDGKEKGLLKDAIRSLRPTEAEAANVNMKVVRAQPRVDGPLAIQNLTVCSCRL